MPLKESDAIVLRSYPLREADLLVSFFTRAEGKLRGVARSAKKSRKRFGGALEPLTTVRLYWEDREREELARIDSCELLASPLSDPVNYPRAIALAHVAEVLDELMPEREANEVVFRLSLAILARLRGGGIWGPLTYFDLWMVRLTGFLPELGRCTVCGAQLGGERAYFHPLREGLLCAQDKGLGAAELGAESRRIAKEMFRRPAECFAGEDWSRTRASDLRRFLLQLIERQIEKRLVTAAMLAKI
jgi:DNA repair protein RecO (recombination protein O)